MVIVVKDPGSVQVYICIYYIGSLIFNCLLWFIRTSVGVHVVGFGILSIYLLWYLRWVTPVCGASLLYVFYCTYLPEVGGVRVYLGCLFGRVFG